MKFKIEIEMDSDTFKSSNGDELARILNEAASEIVGQHFTCETYKTLYDANGNVVGMFVIR